MIVVALEYFSDLFKVSFSSDQERVLKERETFIFFMDFIEDCEGKNAWVGSSFADVTVSYPPTQRVPF